MPTYTNKTYVAFDADSDIRYYRLMQAWKKNNNTSFNFYDAHDLNNLMSYSSEDTIKAKLAERLRNTKVFVLLVGDSTKNLYKFVRWEIEQAINRNIPIIVVNLNGKKSMNSNLCPAILKDELAVHVSFNQKIIEYAIDNWEASDASYRTAGKSGAFYYKDSTYRQLGLFYTFKRWFCNFKSIVADFVTGVGLFWLFVEMTSYSTNSSVDAYLKSVWLFSTASSILLVISLLKNRPKKSFIYKLRDKDNFIEIKVGDAFKNSGALVVPINNSFDVSLGGNVRKAKSLQSKLITDFYSGKEEHLETDIAEKIDLSQSPYDIGTTIEIEQNDKIFYLLVNSRKKENNRVESSADDFLLSLSQLWTYIALETGRNSVVTIPLISTNHGRITNINRETAIKEIIDSYIDASKALNIADKMIISIHPDDLKKGNIDLDELDEFLQFSCRHYKVTTLSNESEGEEVSASVVQSIRR